MKKGKWVEGKPARINSIARHMAKNISAELVAAASNGKKDVNILNVDLYSVVDKPRRKCDNDQTRAAKIVVKKLKDEGFELGTGAVGRVWIGWS